MILHLRIDVCTYRGLQDGVPPLLELLKRTGARGTFYVAMGPDRSGRAIFNLLKPGFAAKMVRTGAPAMYGWRTMLYGTLLPSPLTGAGSPDLLKRIVDAGHELGPHGWNHRRWQDKLDRLDDAEVAGEIARQAEPFGGRPATMAAPAWLVTSKVLELEDGVGLRYASDCRGTAPFVPAGRRTPQVPVTLPTLDEAVGRIDFPGAVIDLAKRQPFACYNAHAESEGRAYRDAFEALLAAFDAVVPLGEAVREGLPPGRIVRGPIDGRAGEVCWQAACNAESTDAVT
jgi:peptidoglycan/xylan/chitin deacetylase (PgdA/CDA1 family)